MLRKRKKRWARGTAGEGDHFDADIQTFQRNLLVSCEMSLSWHLSHHFPPVEGSGVNVVSHSDLAL